MSTERLSKAQQRFITNYKQMLDEVEAAVRYAGECYINNDHDIGDRLVRDILKGLQPFNTQNMTMLSIFSNDDIAMEVLRKFQDAVNKGITIEETFPGERDKMYFVHETFVPLLQKWKQIVEHVYTE
ncbi:hypothetical protein [Texcoconibacillus texcoconensis]|uniref:DUF8042 domain-containing protein n=1 Tax=Texcoconibacillus texcoconensis TaxID=1095777 RepID=A0A840QPX9_9BACI|nr:hypothetical protein [Texcoconibacillus texcoconensis]MBB5173409.1 hypothetical protein [Texcoconibacillus texcoconensis]